MRGRAMNKEMNLVVMDAIKKLLIWIAVAAIVVLAILLPVVVVTGMFGGKPLAGTMALVGLGLLALGVAWYVRSHGERF
jgi:TRAP-type C4-dicarboxylate transport system permease small subunit